MRSAACALLAGLALACAAPGPHRPGAALSAAAAELLLAPPVVRVALDGHAGNAVVLGGGRLASALHVFGDVASGTLRVNGHETGFRRLAAGAGGPGGDWVLLEIEQPDLLAGKPVAQPARAAGPGREFFLVGWLPIAPEAGIDELRELVALPGRIVPAPWLLREAAQGGLCFELDDEWPGFHGLSGSPALVREDGAWRLAGLFSSRLECWPWCEVGILTPLPAEAP